MFQNDPMQRKQDRVILFFQKGRNKNKIKSSRGFFRINVSYPELSGTFQICQKHQNFCTNNKHNNTLFSQVKSSVLTNLRISASLLDLAKNLKLVVTTPTQPQLNSIVGCDMKMTLIHHHHHHHHPHKLNVSNISAVTDPISTKL